MTTAFINGRRLHYTEHGSGRPALLVMGTGSPGRVWQLHQVPALVGAGYRAITLDNRGIDPDGGPPPATDSHDFTLTDMVQDVVGLIAHLGDGPAVIIGTSLGARIAQEVALARPDLVSHLVAMGAYARPEPVQDLLTAGQCALHDQKVILPPAFHAAITALQNLSPTTLRDALAVRDWLDVFEASGSAITDGVRAQHAVQLADSHDRRSAYGRIEVPTLVIGFADDLMVPPWLSREVADVVPGAQYAEIADCGHFGYLERPDAVNATILRFLAERQQTAGPEATEGGRVGTR
ncbi:alpha/beta fold hydrolase [Streptomyces sp. NPDC005963]|uniref:alpha/beta fold hydrolase n=1 Tax=Streptomyces sp. NPDC005963 TaxID=3156721 RepID=UPI0033E321F5